MSVLSARELKAMLKTLLPDQRDPSLVNPASIDLRIGVTVLFEVGGGRWKRDDLGRFSEHMPFVVSPGMLVLASTLERVSIPKQYCGSVHLKSTRAREGFDHAIAGFVDPGWDGILTLEIKNVTQYQTLGIYPGMPFVQLVLFKLSSPVRQGYRGRYQGAVEVEGPK